MKLPLIQAILLACVRSATSRANPAMRGVYGKDKVIKWNDLVWMRCRK